MNAAADAAVFAPDRGGEDGWGGLPPPNTPVRRAGKNEASDRELAA